MNLESFSPFAALMITLMLPDLLNALKWRILILDSIWYCLSKVSISSKVSEVVILMRCQVEISFLTWVLLFFHSHSLTASEISDVVCFDTWLWF